MKKIQFKFLLFAAIFIINHANAQVWMRGYLKDSITHHPIANGEIKNKIKTATTDENGFFRLQMQEGDILLVKASSYQFDTVHVYLHSIDSALIIYLKPLGNILENVTVKTNYSAYQIDSLRRRKAFEENSSKMSVISKEPHPGFGLVFNLDRIGNAKDKNRKQKEKRFEQTEQWSYVRSRFSVDFVKAYTGLSGDSLNLFINKYTPSYQWLRDHPTDEEVIYYISDKMKEFKKAQVKTF